MKLDAIDQYLDECHRRTESMTSSQNIKFSMWRLSSEESVIYQKQKPPTFINLQQSVPLIKREVASSQWFLCRTCFLHFIKKQA